MAIFGADRIDSGEIVLTAFRRPPARMTRSRRASALSPRTGSCPESCRRWTSKTTSWSPITGASLGSINEKALAQTCDEYVKKLDTKSPPPAVRGTGSSAAAISKGDDRALAAHQQRVPALTNLQRAWTWARSRTFTCRSTSSLRRQGRRRDFVRARRGFALLCDRVAVMREGQILNILDGEDIKANTIMHYAAG